MFESSMLRNKHWKIEQLDMCIKKLIEDKTEFASKQ